MKQKIEKLLQKNEILVKCNIVCICMNPDDLAELREEMKKEALEVLNKFNQYRIRVSPKYKLSILNETEAGRFILFDGKRIKHFAGKD